MVVLTTGWRPQGCLLVGVETTWEPGRLRRAGCLLRAIAEKKESLGSLKMAERMQEKQGRKKSMKLLKAQGLKYFYVHYYTFPQKNFTWCIPQSRMRIGWRMFISDVSNASMPTKQLQWWLKRYGFSDDQHSMHAHNCLIALASCPHAGSFNLLTQNWHATSDQPVNSTCKESSYLVTNYHSYSN